MKIFDDKKFRDILVSIQMLQIFIGFLACFNAIKRNWIRFHTFNEKERSVKLQVVEIFSRSKKEIKN